MDTANTPDPAEVRQQQAHLDFVRLRQIQWAVCFLQFYHNHDITSNNMLRRAAYGLFILMKDEWYGWGKTYLASNPEEYDLPPPQEDGYPRAQNYDDHLFMKEVWAQLRKSWMDGVSVQEATRKAFTILIDYCKSHKEFTEGNYLRGVAEAWDHCSSDEKEAFMDKYFSIGANAFGKWMADIETREAHGPAERLANELDQYQEFAKWIEKNRDALRDYQHSRRKKAHYYEFGSVGAELRHLSEFFTDSDVGFHEMAYKFVFRKYAEQFVGLSEDEKKDRILADPAFETVPLTKQELDELHDKDCMICYLPFSIPDSSDETEATVPVKIHCGHVLCKDCVTIYFRGPSSDEGGARCPKCRARKLGPGTTEYSIDCYYTTLVCTRWFNDESWEICRVGGPSAYAEHALRGIDQYLACLPSDVFENLQFSHLEDDLANMATHVFGSPEETPSFEEKYINEESEALLARAGIAGFMSLRNRLEAYIHGDTSQYKAEVKRGLQLKALADTLQFYKSLTRGYISCVWQRESY